MPPLVFVVDDTVAIRQVLRRAVVRVRPAAWVVEAGSVADARALLAQLQFSAVFTDYHLPDGTGLDVLAAVQAQSASIPVVVLSGDVTVEASVRAAGAVAFLPKPLELPQLFAFIEQVLPT